VLVCWWGRFDWSFARLTAPVVTTTFIILSSSKIQNGDVLVLANPDSSGKWPLKWREKLSFTTEFGRIDNALSTDLYWHLIGKSVRMIEEDFLLDSSEVCSWNYV